MKEATSEINLTVIIVIAVGVLVAFFTFFLWPNIKSDMSHTANCNDAVCDPDTLNNGMVECHSVNDATTFRCAYKG